MAYAVQFPERQGEVAVVLRGKEGTGKGVSANQFGRLLGPHFLHVVPRQTPDRAFQRPSASVLDLFADEAFFAGDSSS